MALTESESNLFRACLEGNPHRAQMIMEDGCSHPMNVNAKDADGKTLADLAVLHSFGTTRQRAQLLEMLVRWGLDWAAYPDVADFQIAAGLIPAPVRIHATTPEEADRRLYDFIRNGITAYLAQIPPAIAADSYALSIFLFEDVCDELSLHVGVHTESQVAQRLQRDISPREARWNLPVWSGYSPAPEWGNQHYVVILDIEDPQEGIDAREQWLKSHGWWLQDMEFEDDDEEFVLNDAARMAFWQLVAQVAVDLRAEGLIRATFPQDLAVAIHETHCCGDETIEATSLANPDGQADGFMRACGGLG